MAWFCSLCESETNRPFAHEFYHDYNGLKFEIRVMVKSKNATVICLDCARAVIHDAGSKSDFETPRR